MTQYRVSLRREWDECFPMSVEAESPEQAVLKAEEEVQHISTNWNNMEEVRAIAIFVDDPTSNEELWERPLPRNEWAEVNASRLLEALELIARMKKSGETNEDGSAFDMAHEDAFDTLHSLIDEARKLTANAPEADPS